MTTPTGAITFLDIIEELDGVRTPRPISLNDTDVRELAGIPSGAITLNDLRGKSAITITLPGSYGTFIGSSGSSIIEPVRWNYNNTATIDLSTGDVPIANTASGLNQYEVKINQPTVSGVAAGYTLFNITPNIYKSAELEWNVRCELDAPPPGGQVSGSVSYTITLRKKTNTSEVYTCIITVSMQSIDELSPNP